MTKTPVRTNNFAFSDGGYVVTWISDGGIYAQCYDTDGNAVGSETRVNTTTSRSSHDGDPAVTTLPDGGYVVTWAGHIANNSSSYGIYAQRYDADGNAIGSETRVNTTIRATETNSDVTALSDGGYVVTWNSANPENVYAQRYDADGNAVGSETRVNTTTSVPYQGSLAESAVTGLSDGGYVVTWIYQSLFTIPPSFTINAQRYDADGNAVGSEIRLPTVEGSAGQTDVTALSDGGYVVTTMWPGDIAPGLAGPAGTVVRRYDTDGNAVGSGTFIADGAGAAVATLSDGGYVVAWSGGGIFAQRYDADGNAVGSKIHANTTTAGDGSPAVDAFSDGYVLTWQSGIYPNYDIRAQVIDGNDAQPEVTAPGGLATDEDTALVINGFAVDDPDDSQLTVTLTAASTLTLLQIDGLAFTDGDGTADQKMTFSGAIADINAALAGMTYAPTADFNGTGGFVYTLDDGNGEISGGVAINVDAVNDAPTITSNGAGATASVFVAENSTAVTMVTATDPDAVQALSYSIIGGADANKFGIDSDTGALRFITAPNFEAPTDMDGNNRYDLTVRASDGQGGTDTQAIAVTVTNANETPTIISDGGDATAYMFVAENSTAVTMVTATDPDAGQALSYSIIGGADANRFTINSNTGALRFVTAPNFEVPTDMGGNNRYDMIVQVSDLAGFIDTQAIAVTVTNANETPTITSNGGGATANVSVAENNTAITMVMATDPDAGQALSYSIVGGADAAKFGIDSNTGTLRFITAPNFEAPSDIGGNNSYDVTVRASDGQGGADTQAIAVTVTNANETPTITSNGGGATANVSVAENSAAVTTVTATDPDAGQAPSYSIIGGADANRFTINFSTGALRFVTAPNFEVPTDMGANNRYDLTVRASDGQGGADTQAIAVTVTNVEGGDTLGGAGNDVLVGGGGADTMQGFAGNDTYVVNHVSDQAIEALNAGIDLVNSGVTFTLGANVENLTLTGAAAINGTGNMLSNTIIGNGANNVLDGLGGADTMQGLAGNDIYVVDHVTDQVVENAGAGTDRIISSVTEVLALNVEHLTLSGQAAISGTGNTLDNAIVGNAANNILNGREGNDSLTGAAGNDILIGGGNRDIMTGGMGADDFDFNAIAEMGRTAATRDIITDFTVGDDIDFSTIDANGAVAGNAAFGFLAANGAAFTGAAGQLRWQNFSSLTLVEGDINGDRVADFQIQLTGSKNLTAADFIL